MIIQTIKKRGNGWWVNGITYVHNDTRNPPNPDLKGVLSYIEEGGIVEDEFTTEDLDAQAAAQRAAELQATDSDMLRIAEDLIDTLISKGVITEADLPQAARNKLNNRKTKRAAL
jgi:hypothetical protein